MALRDLITADTVLDYARAGMALARAMQRLKQHGYGSIVVPSRGAVPIINIAQSYYREIIKPCVALEDRLKLHDFFSLPMDFQAPFTADAGQLGVAGLSTADMRRYWVRVIAAITRGDVNNHNYRLFRFVRDDLCRVGHHDSLEWRMRDPRFIFVDTVISGQAVAEIAEAFDAEGLVDIHYVLLLDENGSRLKAPFADRLRALEHAGRATLIRVPCLFTEDQGPAVSGVWSVVIPKLMEVARAERLFNDGTIGAGLYYTEVRQRPDRSNVALTVANARLGTLLHQAIHVAVDPDAVAEDMDNLEIDFASPEALDDLFMQSAVWEETFGYHLEAYLEHIEGHALFDKSATYQLAAAKLIAGCGGKKVDVDVSSSHCLRLHISEEDAATLMRQFNETLTRPYWANAECTKRFE